MMFTFNREEAEKLIGGGSLRHLEDEVDYAVHFADHTRARLLDDKMCENCPVDADYVRTQMTRFLSMMEDIEFIVRREVES